MTSTPASLDCYAIVAPGLEPFALAEAKALGLEARLEDGGVAWTGDAASVIRANLGMRIASRVVVRLAHLRARTFFELERHARKIDWSHAVRPGDAVRFRVTSKKSKLYHTDAVAQRLGFAIVKAVKGVRIADDTDDDGDVDAHGSLVIVRILRDECTVSADTSGTLLHRRGYKEAVGKAPLRETIAAAMLAASEWDRTSPLVDPFCGSGTIPIEAALLAADVPPGRDRHFAIEHWPGVTKALVEGVRSERAAAGRPVVMPLISGSDRDAGAIANASANAARAGMGGGIAFTEAAISSLAVPAVPRGWIVTNPPYGIRVSESSQVRDVWARFGQVLRERAHGWRVAILSPDQALDRQLGIPVRVVAKTANGGIPVRIIVADVP